MPFRDIGLPLLGHRLTTNQAWALEVRELETLGTPTNLHAKDVKW